MSKQSIEHAQLTANITTKQLAKKLNWIAVALKKANDLNGPEVPTNRFVVAS